jgi:hypothetical protein
MAKYNTTIDFELYDGRSVPMTLAFYALYQLKTKDKKLYEKYMQIMQKTTTDELEMVTVLYTAYVCANLSDFGNVMSEEEFMMQCGSDRMAIINTYRDLTQPKKA